MISGVSRDINGTTETFRLTARAMMAIEDCTGQGIVDVMQGLQSGFRITTIVRLLAETANDGKGRDLEWAANAHDAMGTAQAGELIMKLAEAAFPEASEKNAKRARRPK